MVLQQAVKPLVTLKNIKIRLDFTRKHIKQQHAPEKKTYETKINFHTRMMEREKLWGRKETACDLKHNTLSAKEAKLWYGHAGTIGSLELTDNVSVDRSIRTNSEVCKAVQIQPNVPKLNKWHLTVQSVTENNSECRETHT